MDVINPVQAQVRGMSLFALIILVFVAFLVVRGFANPRARPFLLGLGAVIGMGIVFVFFSLHVVRSQRSRQEIEVPQSSRISIGPVEGDVSLPRPPEVLRSYGRLAAEVKAPSGTQSGDVRMEYRLYDNNLARDCSIDVKYSPDRGKTWHPATEAEGGSGISGLSTSQFGGSRHTFLWNSLADIGAARISGVQIRIEPSSGNDSGMPGTSSFFVVDNRKLSSHSTKPIVAPRNSGAAKTSMIAALGDAFFRVWTDNKPRSSAAALTVAIAEKPEGDSPIFAAPPSADGHPGSAKIGTVPKSKSPAPPGPQATLQPPDWVNAAPKLQGNVYLETLHIGPYTTPLECDRELPKALQAAVAEYADLLLGHEQAQAVRLPDEVLQPMLVRQRYRETRPLEINGITQDMTTLDVQIGFDPALQQQIRSMAEHAANYAIVGQRLKLSGLVLGGVLGLLGLVWIVLGAAVKRPVRDEAQKMVMGAEGKGRHFPFVLLGVLLAAAVVLAGLFVGVHPVSSPAMPHATAPLLPPQAIAPEPSP